MKLTNAMRDEFVAAVMVDVPTINYAEQIETVVRAMALQQFPTKILAAVDSSVGFLHHDFIGVHGITYHVPVPPGVDVESIRRETESLARARDLQRTARAVLRSQLMSVANTYTTVGALADAVPELARYVPGAMVQAQLVPANAAEIVAVLRCAGWKESA